MNCVIIGQLKKQLYLTDPRGSILKYSAECEARGPIDYRATR